MKNTIFCLMILFLFSCKKENILENEWDIFSVNSNISKNINFKKMNSEKEFEILFDSASLKKRTNNIIFLSDSVINFKDTLDTRKNMFTKSRKCYALFYKSDTLKMNVISSDGFSGNGFTISVFENKYKIDCSSFTDVEPFENEKPKLDFSFRKLILNKKEYKANDSIFGYIEFKCKDEDSYPKPVERFAKGYFRSKIEKY